MDSTAQSGTAAYPADATNILVAAQQTDDFFGSLAAKLGVCAHVDTESANRVASDFASLPSEFLHSCMRYVLSANDVVALSTTEHAVRQCFWCKSRADELWRALVVHEFSTNALSLSLRVCDSRWANPAVYSAAEHLRRRLRNSLKIARGSVANRRVHGDDVDVVACPCRKDLINLGFGAQQAIIDAVGPSLENFIEQLPVPQPEANVTLAPGGELAKHVALTITQVPYWVFTEEARALAWLTTLHSNLLHAVREKGCFSVALPTLCTGGMGVDPRLVTAGLAAAVLQDFNAHPQDPLRVVLCCFEEMHAAVMEEEWDRTCVGMTCVEPAETRYSAAYLALVSD